MTTASELTCFSSSSSFSLTEPGNENVADQNKTHPSLLLPQKLSAEQEAETKNEIKEKAETKRKIEAQKDQGAVANPNEEDDEDW